MNERHFHNQFHYISPRPNIENTSVNDSIVRAIDSLTMVAHQNGVPIPDGTRLTVRVVETDITLKTLNGFDGISASVEMSELQQGSWEGSVVTWNKAYHTWLTDARNSEAILLSRPFRPGLVGIKFILAQTGGNVLSHGPSTHVTLLPSQTTANDDQGSERTADRVAFAARGASDLFDLEVINTLTPFVELESRQGGQLFGGIAFLGFQMTDEINEHLDLAEQDIGTLAPRSFSTKVMMMKPEDP